MKQRTRSIAVIVFAGLCVGFIVWSVELAVRRTNTEPRRDARLKKLDEHCLTVSVALGQLANQLSSGIAAVQQAAADRMGGEAALTSEYDILLCSDIPPDLRMRDRCWLSKDYACLEKMARLAAETTKPR